MKILRHILILPFIFFAILSTDGESVTSWIRKKVEHLAARQTLNDTVHLFCSPTLQKQYHEHFYAPFWSSDVRIDELMSLIRHCDVDGLQPMDYHLRILDSLARKTGNENAATRDILLTDAFILLSSHLLNGKIDPQTITPCWNISPVDDRITRFLIELPYVRVGDFYRSIIPQSHLYEGLRLQLKRYREIEKQGGWKTIPSGKILRPGNDDSRVALIRKRLLSTGEYDGPEPEQPNFYDDQLSEAVILFQRNHGLEALGTIGPQTLAEMNTPASERIRQIEVNMERIRWLPESFPDYYILINIPDYMLFVYDHHIPVGEHKVIVGRTYRKTPIFHSTLQYLVFNPTWTIPPNILKYDILPEAQKDSGYLAQRNIQVFESDGTKLKPEEVNFASADAPGYTYRQLPGDQNALGVVKFVFPNPYNVFLHDTPSKRLFNRVRRTFSSGCIRVERPIELAQYLLMEQPEWTSRKIDKTIESRKTQVVRFNRKPEVFLVYLTAWENDDGQLQFRDDIYSRDEPIYKELKSSPDESN
ncbi:murein L,D-transpeptidase [Prolixibacter sp. NT017]|uniref:L,D-transpeptidase family protein n=1 Tax=Prolixibacter sp. NT017 TaxID=2652390 RepID=UPI00126D9914|nr:L,D-transpeptidase family protein [Prolixibacter sp. NT017]GET25909.1 peptidoglycan-binding protein [Prolixibacter sp. NT017]